MPISSSIAPSSASVHPATALLHKLSCQGFPTFVGYHWLLQTIQEVILQVPYVSTNTAEDTYFYQGELVERISRGFSVILSAANDIKLFASFPKKNLRDWLICYSTAKPLGDDPSLPQYLIHHHFIDIPPTPDVNSSTNKYLAPVTMHFGSYLSRLLQ